MSDSVTGQIGVLSARWREKEVLLYMRHCSCDSPTGYPDPYGLPLSAGGRRHARECARRLSQIPITRIVASPYRRTTETAEIVARECRLPLEQLDDLREWTLPPLHGMSA